MLTFFPHYNAATVNNMVLNVMAHWNCPVDLDINFKTLTSWNDHVVADIKRRNEAASKPPTR